MALHPSLSEPHPVRDPRGFMPDADACVDDLLALAEWMRDRSAGSEAGDRSEEAAA